MLVLVIMLVLIWLLILVFKLELILVLIDVDKHVGILAFPFANGKLNELFKAPRPRFIFDVFVKGNRKEEFLNNQLNMNYGFVQEKIKENCCLQVI